MNREAGGTDRAAFVAGGFSLDIVEAQPRNTGWMVFVHPISQRIQRRFVGNAHEPSLSTRTISIAFMKTKANNASARSGFVPQQFAHYKLMAAPGLSGTAPIAIFQKSCVRPAISRMSYQS